eukprot:4905672-Lingulodinium_polyedra.AAC.1
MQCVMTGHLRHELHEAVDTPMESRVALLQAAKEAFSPTMLYHHLREAVLEAAVRVFPKKPMKGVEKELVNDKRLALAARRKHRVETYATF